MKIFKLIFSVAVIFVAAAIFAPGAQAEHQRVLLSPNSTLSSPTPNIQPKHLGTQAGTSFTIDAVNVTIEEIPYQVHILVDDKFACGGSLISTSIVLTAAHCLTNLSSNYTIRAGSVSPETGGTVHKVKDVMQHENYTSNKRGGRANDIGLIRLAEPIKIDATHKPIELFGKGDEEISRYANPVTTGYGRTLNTTNGGDVDAVLLKIEMYMFRNDDCNEAYAWYGGISENQICANVHGPDTFVCDTDSGNALVIENRQAGILSMNSDCSNTHFPSVYTEVSRYRDWIAKNGGVSNA